MKKYLFLMTLLLLFVLSCRQTYKHPWQNPRLSVEERVNALVASLTLEEKVSQLLDRAPAIERLDIPEYNWWNECLHGVARAGFATVFPQAIGLGATWNTELMLSVSDVISTEARAKHHEALRQGDFSQYKGLTFWSPNINIFRDPRWGRGQETYGEDPYLTARMGVAFVKGLQGDFPDYFKVIATPKHYAVHSGPEPDRHRFDAVTGEQDLYETYLPAFKATVMEAGAYSVMCAYNRYKGEACCSSPFLLHDILRKDWGFEGYIVSDCGAIRDIHAFHKITKTAAQSAALAVKSGTDLNCGRTYRALLKAVEEGLISEEEIDVPVKRLFTARIKLGMFDPPGRVPFSKIPYSENDSPEHSNLALKAAQESIVLLKNRDGFLPLKKNLKQIAVIGPNAASETVLLGNYNGTPSDPVTVLEGIQNRAPESTKIVYKQGVNLVDKSAVLDLVPTEVLGAEGQPGLEAEYYSNTNFEGEPILTRVDKLVNSNWTTDPVEGLDSRNFSIRWTGTLTPAESGMYTLALTGDDGYRLYVNEKLLIENWSIHSSETRFIETLLNAGTSYDIKIEYYQGNRSADIRFEWGLPGQSAFQDAVDAAAESDAAIFVGGISPALEGEEMRVTYEGFKGGDRISIDLPAIQHDLIRALYETGTPVVLVLMSGSAVAVNWEDENLPAILASWYPGQQGGNAVADVLFGRVSPSGKLPVTFYKSEQDLPPFEDYNMKGRTYRFFDGEPLYAFGHGLSYSDFEYSDLQVTKIVKTGDPVKVEINLKNTGRVKAAEVVQLYLRDVIASAPRPIKELKAFKKVPLDPGESKKIELTVESEQLAFYDEKIKNWNLEPGVFELMIGSSSQDIRLVGTFEVK
ncbi:glycoside hydrolase family 3 C-terminal domain-containing protein [candidate division KSB1 bacterium]|nr:glycoside hydrolase family 3 C-terminal domain-containing protein [candidate division KSB1 bacterium]